jgi:hypothetical protein
MTRKKSTNPQQQQQKISVLKAQILKILAVQLSECSLACSQKPATKLHPQPDK